MSLPLNEQNDVLLFNPDTKQLLTNQGADIEPRAAYPQNLIDENEFDLLTTSEVSFRYGSRMAESKYGLSEGLGVVDAMRNDILAAQRSSNFLQLPKMNVLTNIPADGGAGQISTEPYAKRLVPGSLETDTYATMAIPQSESSDAEFVNTRTSFAAPDTVVLSSSRSLGNDSQSHFTRLSRTSLFQEFEKEDVTAEPRRTFQIESMSGSCSSC